MCGLEPSTRKRHVLQYVGHADDAALGVDLDSLNIIAVGVYTQLYHGIYAAFSEIQTDGMEAVFFGSEKQ